ncbi:extracellular solute-binding protein [Acidisoma cellulosilytica]|uniref:Extracellular solute-binding protein n=1 Tax=Acidisoma cellulosilyticum TaxID=2802395 RepID=A0A963Z3V2_9PROT|nr:extracellular solute-binding protein [Acidisoma cellulosilyticum]MCB8882036.1 extracellular solute-binding protein [Acidisoma cellulosilyticum]
MSFTRRSVLAAGALMALPGIARAQTAAFKGQALTVASWQNYGADDAATIKMFEDMTGATVKNVYFTSEDDLLQMLRQGGMGKIDVVLPNLEYVATGAQQSLFQPVDTSKVHSWSMLEERFSADPSIRLNGQVYAVPWVQGATSLAVNTDVHPTPTSWKVLWDPANKGKVGFFDDPTTAIMTAALYLGEDPQNPDLAKVRTALLALKDNVKLFWSSGDDWNKAFTTGEITMGNLWSGLAGTLKTNGHPLDFIFPDDGTVVWGDTWAIVSKTPHLDLAYAWINFLTSPAYFTQWIGSPGPNQELAVPVNTDAVKALPQAAADKLMAGPLLNYKGKVALQTGISPAALKKWTQLWEDVKAS